MIIGAMASGLLLRTLRKTFKHMHGEKDMNSQQSKKTGVGMEVKPYQGWYQCRYILKTYFIFLKGC